MKKQFLLVLALIITSFGYSATTEFANCPKEMLPIIEKIRQLPEGRELIAKAQEKGDIRIAVLKEDAQFSAYWDGARRQILINLSEERTYSRLIGSVVFELHNALADEAFVVTQDKAKNGTISRSAYIREMERIEYENARKTNEILKLGIKRGLFPRDTEWEVPSSFREHFRLQQKFGHAQWHGRMYDRIS